MNRQKKANNTAAKLTVDSAYEQALEHFNNGQYTEADKLCTAIVNILPNHIDAINLLGIIAQTVNQHNIAVKQFKKAITIDNSRGLLYYNLALSLEQLEQKNEAIQALKKALILEPENSQINSYLKSFSNQEKKAERFLVEGISQHQNGMIDDAIIYYKKCLKIAPNNSVANNNLGGALLAKELYSEAIFYLKNAIKIDPEYAGAYNNIGQVNETQGKLDEALINYKKAISIEPDFAQVYNNIGNVNQAQGELETAIKNYQIAIRINPNFAEAYNNYGNVLREQDKLDEAALNIKKAILIQPNYAQAHSNLALTQQKKGMLNDAITSCKKAIAIDPMFAQAHYNMAITLQELGKLKKAVKSYQKAIAINPNYTDAYNNLGNAFKEQGKVADAIKSYKKTITLDPNCADAHHNLSLAQLLIGDFKNGWRNYNLRFNCSQFNMVRYLKHEKALYEGGDVSNKKILLWSEQGVGESILFSSMIPDLIAQGADIVLECDKRLIPLFSRSFPKIKCIENADPYKVANQYEKFDYITPSGNLCRWFREDVNAHKNLHGYLKASTKKTAAIRKRYTKNKNKKIIGIAWHSKNKIHGADKSINLQQLLPLLKLPNVVFVNLQYGDTTSQRDDLTKKSGVKIIHDETIDQMVDIDSFAAQIAAMDMVVTISNTTAHISGALGVPTILMLAANPLWYWMIDRKDSPWYSSISIVRQKTGGEWKQVIEYVTNEVNYITH
ncbi:MAG: tetratricopeptide repeat protein [Magnetococcales bacterium]|nr:tetratricopeptide repeat protein [Magnetococcales bacterium]